MLFFSLTLPKSSLIIALNLKLLRLANLKKNLRADKVKKTHDRIDMMCDQSENNCQQEILVIIEEMILETLGEIEKREILTIEIFQEKTIAETAILMSVLESKTLKSKTKHLRLQINLP